MVEEKDESDDINQEAVELSLIQKEKVIFLTSKKKNI